MIFRRKQDTYVTCRDRDDGGGAQISACISTMIYARLKGIRYAHTPLIEVAHRPDGISPAAWAHQWESFFSLGDGEVTADELSPIKEHRLEKPHRQRPRTSRLNVVAHCQKVSNQHPEQWSELAPELRRKYSLNPKPALAETPSDRKTIAVHLRRGDVSSSGQFSERFTPIEKLLPPLRAILENQSDAQVHLYSQGKPEDFREFAEFEPVWHLDEEVFTSFHGMVQADVLFTAKSTFSYLAAVLRQGATIYEPFWHPALPGWINLETKPSQMAQQVQRAFEITGG
ncbi:MAG: hypothetical protein ACQKBU_09905 [Verrucomicrobiales bacterium]